MMLGRCTISSMIGNVVASESVIWTWPSPAITRTINVWLFDKIVICAETHSKELADRLDDYYNKIHKNCCAEVQFVLEDSDITDVDIDKNINRIQSNG